MVANVLVTVTIFVKTIKLGFEIQFVKIEFWLIFFFNIIYIKLFESWVVICGLILSYDC